MLDALISLPWGVDYFGDVTYSMHFSKRSGGNPKTWHIFQKYTQKQFFPSKSTLNYDVPVSCIPGLLKVQTRQSLIRLAYTKYTQ